MQDTNLAAAALLAFAVVILLLLAGQAARALAYKSAGWRVRAWAFGGLCVIRERGKLRLQPCSLSAGRGVLLVSTVIPETPDIATEADFIRARDVLAKVFRLAREGDLFAAYYLYALLPLQENGTARRERSAFLRAKLAAALGEIPPEKAGKYALEAFDLLLMERMANPGLPEPPAVERYLDHFAQDYQALRRGRAEICPVLFLHVLYALKLRRDDRWKVMEAHVSTVLKALPGGRVHAYYRLQTLQIIYNEDHRAELAKRENLHCCAAWRLLALFECALDDEAALNQRWK